jgi:hypothetical protein
VNKKRLASDKNGKAFITSMGTIRNANAAGSGESAARLGCLGIWAFGFLCYTVFLRMSIPILQGKLLAAVTVSNALPAEEKPH